MRPDPKLWRLAKRAWYRSLHARWKPHTVQARCCGLKFRFSSHSPMGEEIFANAFERIQRSLLDSWIRAGQTIIDVGANLGFYTCLLARRVGPQGRVLAFEPTAATFERLQQNVALNGLDLTVQCRCQALADRTGTALLNVYGEGDDVYNSLGPLTNFCAHGPLAQVQVPTVTLDQVLAEVPADRGCFIKIDVEGFQHQVLLGGRRLLRKLADVSLMVEMHEATARQAGSSTRESLALMDDLGFSAHRMTASGLKPFDRRTDMALLRGELSHDLFFHKAATTRS